MENILQEISSNLYEGKFKVIPELVQGALDQGIDPRKSSQVQERISIFAPGGGFVLGPTQGIEPDVPPENVVAMCEVARDFGQYPIQSQIHRAGLSAF